MPSWNEKPYVIPLINVNLKSCECFYLKTLDLHVVNAPHSCPATPILIPCPIPRSVTFEVRLGECDGRECYSQFMRLESVSHGPNCPARPVKVSCSISPDETWARSEVSGFMSAALESVSDEAILSTVARVCRDRWGFIKSLVLGHSLEDCPEAIRNMLAQRDAAFTALYDMVQAEETLSASANIILQSCNDSRRLPLRADDDASPSENLLRRYIGHILEQVGVLQ